MRSPSALLAVALLLPLAACGWPPCDCGRANAPCVADGFRAAHLDRCRAEVSQSTNSPQWKDP